MNLGLGSDHTVRREWLPVFAIVWISVVSLLVTLRFTLRTTSRQLGLDDVNMSILV
jgi:hypothetical protein